VSSVSESYLTYPKRGYGQDHDFYDWQLSKDRPQLNWQGEAKVAICFIIPLEFFPLNPSGVPFKHPGAMKTPYPDLRHFTVRDYGNRVGVFRILEELKTADIQATFAINGEVARRHHNLVDAISASKHEIAIHGLSTDHIHHEDLKIEDEKAIFREIDLCFPVLSRLSKDLPEDRIHKDWGNDDWKPRIGTICSNDQGFTGKDGKNYSMLYATSPDISSEWHMSAIDNDEIETVKYTGWMSPARNQSSRTLNLIAEQQFQYCLDWEMDQVPVSAKTDHGDITLIPNSYELSDFTLLHARRQTEAAWLTQIKSAIDLLVAEHARFGGQMLGLTLTPYVIGQPFRIWALRALLAHINDRDDVSVLTAGQIDQQFRAQS